MFIRGSCSVSPAAVRAAAIVKLFDNLTARVSEETLLQKIIEWCKINISSQAKSEEYSKIQNSKYWNWSSIMKGLNMVLLIVCVFWQVWGQWWSVCWDVSVTHTSTHRHSHTNSFPIRKTMPGPVWRQSACQWTSSRLELTLPASHGYWLLRLTHKNWYSISQQPPTCNCSRQKDN